MRVIAAAIVAGSLILSTVVLATVALAQSGTPAPAGSAAATPPAAAAPVAPAAAAAPPNGKKPACQSASEAMKGQARKDQMQLCMMQARLDCLKQAIDQNIVGPQRKDFVKSCVG
jgi:Tfp pilus assembly protein FimV